MRRDWIAGTVLLALSIAYYFYAEEIPRSQLSDVVGASSFPKLLAWALGGLSVLLIASGLFGRRPAVSAEDAKAQSAKDLQGFLRAGGTMALGIGYLLIVDWVGYTIAVILLLAGMLLYNGMKLDRRNVFLVATGGCFFWLLFRMAFDIPVPAGIWPNLLGI